ncbi:MAG: DUF421 domain-containing protein [Ruminococcus sp.]|nr:DUF421 domain-containing protein [Ruminococcus sp.]MDE6539631.1 DUF421 domain-containing protein [Ruminococcus sp.]
MSIVLIRSLILYILVIFSVRLMGKRQLGELQPSELVITILISNIATLPLEDTDIPLLLGVTPILALVCFEVIVSWINLVFPKFRKMISGSPKIIIRNGKTDPNTLRELRFSVDDLMMSLREKEVFNLEDVQFAIVETTGNISVMKKQSVDTPDRNDLGLKMKNSDPPQVIVSDGKIITQAVKVMGIEGSIEKILDSINLKLDEVFIMTADTQGNFFIVDKDGNSPHIAKNKGENK